MKKERKYPCICGRQSCTLSLADLLKDIPAIVGYWQQRCKLAEKYLAAVPIDQSQWSSTSAEHHKQMYHEFIRDNQKPE